MRVKHQLVTYRILWSLRIFESRVPICIGLFVLHRLHMPSLYPNIHWKRILGSIVVFFLWFYGKDKSCCYQVCAIWWLLSESSSKGDSVNGVSFFLHIRFSSLGSLLYDNLFDDFWLPNIEMVQWIEWGNVWCHWNIQGILYVFEIDFLPMFSYHKYFSSVEVLLIVDCYYNWLFFVSLTSNSFLSSRYLFFPIFLEP